jgi:phosphatidylethanolamine/phosphatidyl-N-methylethanolamine N-methyltransferase
MTAHAGSPSHRSRPEANLALAADHAQAPIDWTATATTRARYNRTARLFDLMERGPEPHMNSWRGALWQRVRGPRVLEVGAGTGTNQPYYPKTGHITAIDLSPAMVRRAQARASRDHVDLSLLEADAQALPFASRSFDTVVATCVFCSVPDPVLGLRELRRVLTPGGQLLLLEHVLSCRPLLRSFMYLLNPAVVRLVGANINRKTVESVHRAGFVGLQVRDLWLDIMKLIEARTPVDQDTGKPPREPANDTWFQEE